MRHIVTVMAYRGHKCHYGYATWRCKQIFCSRWYHQAYQLAMVKIFLNFILVISCTCSNALHLRLDVFVLSFLIWHSFFSEFRETKYSVFSVRVYPHESLLVVSSDSLLHSTQLNTIECLFYFF